VKALNFSTELGGSCGLHLSLIIDIVPDLGCFRAPNLCLCDLDAKG
jgi:hypothetical protein